MTFSATIDKTYTARGRDMSDVFADWKARNKRRTGCFPLAEKAFRAAWTNAYSFWYRNVNPYELADAIYIAATSRPDAIRRLSERINSTYARRKNPIDSFEIWWKRNGNGENKQLCMSAYVEAMMFHHTLCRDWYARMTATDLDRAWN